ncbi:MAG: ribosomal protein S18-alanine N-acetyltransferase [Anaerolineae bacterium]
MALKIRRGGHTDYDAVEAISREVAAFHTASRPDVFRVPQGPTLPLPYFIELIDDHRAAFFVAEVDGRIVGYVIAYLREVVENPVRVPERYVKVDTLAISAPYRRRGLGRRLMRRVHAWAARHGAVRSSLSVWAFNEGARTLYEGLGYRVDYLRMSKPLGDDPGC